MKSAIYSLLFIVFLVSCQDQSNLPSVTYPLQTRSTQNSMYLELRVGGQKITIAAGSNIAFMVLTGAECAAKEICGKAPGYDYRNSANFLKILRKDRVVDIKCEGENKNENYD